MSELSLGCLQSPLEGGLGRQSGFNLFHRVQGGLQGKCFWDLFVPFAAQSGGGGSVLSLDSRELPEEFWLNPFSTPLAVIWEKY